MKLITRDTDYAVRALCYIAKREKMIVTASDLVKCLRIPRPFLRKIMQKLNAAGFLKSYKGARGGFKLSRDPKTIDIPQLIGIFQGPVRLNEHLFKKAKCPHIKMCILKNKLDKIERYVARELKSITIASLI